jgi:peptidyl-tRNA hydrolase, PTH1 family
MSLFQKRPQVGEVMSYYTMGLGKTILLVGLGNPGKEYEQTRHNVGFACIDHFVSHLDEMSDWIEKKDLKCLYSSGQLGQTHVIAIKPATFMNLSGEAVQAVMSFYKIPLQQVAIIYDELDINFGQIRTRVGGSSAGHNGIKSITGLVGEETGRIRIGIGPKKPAQIDASDFVLQKFKAEELKQLPALIREVSAILTEYIYGGQLAAETRSFVI